ncbi:Meckel syndrome type 1 protein [Lamellibrachia satsuma]|nr:Meckel syndrome type 1 protein [Lamellibrachia satsuma]
MNYIMGDLYEPDRGTAFYRSTDPIKNLQIRVTLERMTSAVGMPPSVAQQGQADGLEMKSVREDKEPFFGGMKDVEMHTFKWQEKVFSQREIELYKDEANCDTVVDKKYHEDVLRVLAKGHPTRWLFSYTDSDNYVGDDGDDEKITTSPNEKPTILAEKMKSIRHRRIAPPRLRAINTPMSKVSIVDYNPPEEQRKKHHYLALGVQTMYIMADVSPDTRPATPDDEFVLCAIQIDSRGVLSIQPDFNNGRKPYRLEAGILGSGRDMFEYVLEHTSKQLTSQEQSRELKMYKELYNRHSAFLAECVGREFEMPPMDVLRLLVYAEIESAQNFEYGDLYVQYFMELPDGEFVDIYGTVFSLKP